MRHVVQKRLVGIAVREIFSWVQFLFTWNITEKRNNLGTSLEEAKLTASDNVLEVVIGRVDFLPQPLVLAHLLQGETLLGVLDEDGPDEVDAARRHLMRQQQATPDRLLNVEEGVLPKDDDVEKDSEAPDLQLGPLVRVALQHLRAAVLDRAVERVHLDARLVQDRGAEVDQLYLEALVDYYVLVLDVAMQNATRMHESDGVNNLNQRRDGI